MPEVAEKVKSILFICPSGYEATLVVKSEDFIAVDGRAIKQHAHRIGFRKKPFGGSWRGEFLTDNPVEIEFIRNHDWYRSGPPPDIDENTPSRGTSRLIYETEFNPDLPRKVPDVVKQRNMPKPPEPTVEAPNDPIQKPTKAKVSKKLPKTQ